MSVLVLIDADPLIYACGFMGEEREYVVRPVKGRGVKRFPSAAERDEWLEKKGLEAKDVTIERVVHPKPFSHCRQALRMSIAGIRENVGEFLREEGLEYGPERLYLTGGTNFRLEVATIRGYKANRVAPKPHHYKALREYMIHDLDATLTDGTEADDEVAMLQWMDYARQEEPGTIICTIDKDLDQVPGLHYNYSRKEAYVLSEDTARANFWRQVLTGDSTDNIPGCYRVGPAKAAEAIMDTMSEYDQYCVALETYSTNMLKYPDHHHPHTEPRLAVHENAKLLHMLRHPKDEWQPPEAP